MVGCDLVTTEPKILKVGEWGSFWERVTNPERQLPYIFVATKGNAVQQCIEYSVDPKQLAIAAGGNAYVFYAESQSVMEEMDYYCPQEYKCYNGSIRIYFPRVDLTDALDSHKHRYLNSSTILQLGQDGVVQMFRRALAQDVHFYESFFRIGDCRLKQENRARQLRLAELKRQHEEKNRQITQEKEQEAKDWCDIAAEEEEKRLQAEDELEQARVALKTVKEENYNLSVEIEAYRTLVSKNAELERACENRLNTKFYPRTSQDIVNYFDATFGDCIAFSEDVDKSLKACTIPCEELWNILYCLATTMRELYISGKGDIYKEFKNKTGITIGRGEGANTHQNKKLMKQYETEYHGRIIDIEAHVKCLRNHQRVHFGFSLEEQKVIVGWCGEHKDNATTQKVK